MGHLVGHDLRWLAARGRVVLAAIEAGDEIAYDLMVTLAEELVAVEKGAARDEGALRRLAARGRVVLTAIEAGDEIAYDLMVRLAEELVVVKTTVAQGGVGVGSAPNRSEGMSP